MATLALPIGGAAMGVALLVAAAAWLRLLPPLVALGSFTLALFAGGGLSLLLGIVGVVRGGEGRAAALAAVLVGLLCLAAIGSLAVGARAAPPIHDISTDLNDPPVFVAAARNDANRGRDLAYPNGSPQSATLQQRAYPDLAPLHIAATPGEVFPLALAVAGELGWTIGARDAGAGIFEAEDETAVFGFVDDVVVRVRPVDGGALLDVRSLSRQGVGDLGANAARIRRFRDALTTARR